MLWRFDSGSDTLVLYRLSLLVVLIASNQSVALNCTSGPPPSMITDEWTINVCIASIFLGAVQVVGVVANIIANRWAYHLSHHHIVEKALTALSGKRAEHRALRRQGIEDVKSVLADMAQYIRGEDTTITCDEEWLKLLGYVESVLEGRSYEARPRMEEESTE